MYRTENPYLRMSKRTPPPQTLQILSFIFLILPFHGNSQTSPNSEQTTLLKLKQYWSSPPYIVHWAPSSNSTAHCTWPEITCIAGSVTGLTLPNINITGAIPPFICDLKNLTFINLRHNYIPGSFPAVLYNCSNLQHLDLSENLLVGPIPDDVHLLSPQLRYLNLTRNNFSGEIPPTIGQLSGLTTLEMLANLFNGSFPPEIGNLSNLQILGVDFNGFAPHRFPPSFTKLKKLKELWMAQTNLHGGIPESIGNLTSLEILDLSQNFLTGNIPSQLFLLENLTVLYLYGNDLTGSIPQSVEAVNLEDIDLSANNLTGRIPEDFGKLTKLSVLHLYFNKLSGEVPVSIGLLPALVVFRIFTNNLSGEFPPDFGRYSMLQYFEVASNQFVGKIPEYLCTSGMLLGLVVFDNNLSGELPRFLGNCSSLLVVRVENNGFSGQIPEGLWTSSNLQQLMMSNNTFTGQLPDKFGSNISILEICNNQFSGEISAEISSCESLRVFKASNNIFSGTIPQELTLLPLLTTLLLDGNRLSGLFPSRIQSWTSLTTLNLSQNQLSGQIPAAIGFLPRLTDLDLSNNQFSGQIPSEFNSLTLTSLNLSSNRLTGRIPSVFDNGAFDSSFLNNTALCANNPSLGLNTCKASSRRSDRVSSKFIATVTITAVVASALAILFAAFVIISYRRKKYGLDLKWHLTSFQKLNFTESKILSGLTENNVIGSGGSGKVYRVSINRSRDCVAVKKIWNKKLDQKLEKEFQAEVQVLSTIRHSNIVKLLCCISSEKAKLLVYQFLENQSLDRWLHGKRGSIPTTSTSVHHVVLDWPKRLQIAVGAARGLCYMHHDCLPPIIHRDVKSSNILLDSDFNAKIADFGLARMLVKHGEPNTMSAVAGSFGYMAPEYAHTTKVNEKIDVYSFGVVLLELATGREAGEGDDYTSLAEWAWRHVQESIPIVDVLDENVKESSYLCEMSNVFKLGIICTSTLPSTRPSMKEVLQILLRSSHSQALVEKDTGRSEVDSFPLLKNSKREQALERDDEGVASIC